MVYSRQSCKELCGKALSPMLLGGIVVETGHQLLGGIGMQCVPFHLTLCPCAVHDLSHYSTLSAPQPTSSFEAALHVCRAQSSFTSYQS